MYYNIVKIPRDNLKIRISPITNEIFFNICKFIENNDDEDIAIYIDEILQKLIDEDNIFSKLNRVDKTIILVKLYENYIDPNITLFCKHKENTDIRSINIESSIISKKIEDLSIDHFEKIKYGDIIIEISTPSALFCKTYDEIITSMIHKIYHDGEEYYFNSFSEYEKDKFFESVNLNLIKICSEIIESNAVSLKLLDISDSFEYEDFYINYFDNSLYALVKSLFSFDVKYLYENSYVFCKAMGSSYDHFKQLTPVEFTQLINIHKHYNDKINDYNEEMPVDFS